MITPRRARRSRFSRWPACSGVSRTASSRVRRSLSTTSAARLIRSPVLPVAMFEAVRTGNSDLAAGRRGDVARNLADVRAMLGVLGLDPLAEPWVGLDSVGSSGDRLRRVMEGLVDTLLEQRQEARKRKDFAAADALRDRLGELGIVVEDGPSGTRWELAD
jgi:cysteinyl-tRNA synthetase